jgi:hypothetical protein
MTQKYDPKIHDVNFHSVYENETMKEAFLKHLEKECNSEAFLFYFEVQEFVKITDFEEKKKEFKRIFQLYFTEGIEGEEKCMELNIPGKVKAKMKKKYENIDTNTNLETEEQYLMKIAKTVNQELELDAVKFHI